MIRNKKGREKSYSFQLSAVPKSRPVLREESSKFFTLSIFIGVLITFSGVNSVVWESG